MNIRVLELGSNSFQLHGFEVSAGGRLKQGWGIKRSVLLGQGVTVDGLLDPAYAVRGVEAVRELFAASGDDAPLVCVATSAVREARNRDLLLAPLSREFGLRVRILSGSEEARLSFHGALASIDARGDRVCVADIGGGSTELAIGDEREVTFTHSARVGTLLGERAGDEFGRHLTPVLHSLRGARPERLVFGCGCARALRRLVSQLGLVSPTSPIPTEVIERLLPSIATLSADELAAFGISADRASTLPAGSALIALVARHLRFAAFDVSEGGLREGVALEYGHGVGRLTGKFPVVQSASVGSSPEGSQPSWSVASA